MVENVALTRTQTRTVEEMVLHLLLGDEGGRVELPVAIVTDRNPDRTLKAIRVYHSMWPLTGEHALRPPLLPADSKLHAQGVVGDYQRALAEGDLESIVETFQPDGYAREPSGGAYGPRAVVGQQAEKLELSPLEAVGVVRGAQAARRFLTEQCEQQTRAKPVLFERRSTCLCPI